MKMFRPPKRLDIGLVIPARNEGQSLDRLLEQARSLGVFSEIIVVDDGSQKPLARDGVDLTIRQNQSLGAGVGRNIGLRFLRSEYVLFFDADDELTPELPLLLDDLANQLDGFDICMFRHADGRGLVEGKWSEPAPEVDLWEQTGLGAGALLEVQSPARPILAQTINYPWNKILRTDFLRQEGISCAPTRVHNDIPLHWLSLLKAPRVFTSDRICAVHHFGDGNGFLRVSDAQGEIRAQMFDALAYVVPALDETASSDWYSAFTAFSLGLANWAEVEKGASNAPMFQQAKEDFFARLPWADAKKDSDTPFSDIAAPSLNRCAPIRFARVGPHQHRSPLAHDSLQPLWNDQLQEVGAGDRADIILAAHPHDLAAAPISVARRMNSEHAPRIVVLSEEPLWDVLFSPDPLAPIVEVSVFQAGMLPARQVNHLNDPLFQFQKLPYFVLTDHRFANAYASRFAQNARMGAKAWAACFAQREARMAFIAGREVGGHHDRQLKGGQIVGQSAWRSRLAQSLTGQGALLHGEGWSHDIARRDLRNWHLDKLVRFDRRSVMISAIENTHCTEYISEKLFDAFAMGSMPVYRASASHGIHRLGLPEGSWINLWGMSKDEAAHYLKSFQPDATNCDAFVQAQRVLAGMFVSSQPLHHERRRFGRALVEMIKTTLDERAAQAGP